LREKTFYFGGLGKRPFWKNLLWDLLGRTGVEMLRRSDEFLDHTGASLKKREPYRGKRKFNPI
jgi:hypothetical protein